MLGDKVGTGCAFFWGWRSAPDLPPCFSRSKTGVWAEIQILPQSYPGGPCPSAPSPRFAASAEAPLHLILEDARASHRGLHVEEE